MLSTLNHQIELLTKIRDNYLNKFCIISEEEALTLVGKCLGTRHFLENIPRRELIHDTIRRKDSDIEHVIRLSSYDSVSECFHVRCYEFDKYGAFYQSINRINLKDLLKTEFEVLCYETHCGYSAKGYHGIINEDVFFEVERLYTEVKASEVKVSNQRNTAVRKLLPNYIIG